MSIKDRIRELTGNIELFQYIDVEYDYVDFDINTKKGRLKSEIQDDIILCYSMYLICYKSRNSYYISKCENRIKNMYPHLKITDPFNLIIDKDDLRVKHSNTRFKWTTEYVNELKSKILEL